MSDKKSKEQILALRAPDEKTIGKYRERCEWSLERAFGDNKSLRIDSVQLYYVYKFTLSLTGLCRRLEYRAGGDHGSGEKNVLGKDLWSIVKEGTEGNFAIALPGTTEEETCHKCKGNKSCSHCDGTGKTKCSECHGDGKCDDCGGSGLQTCPNCHGKRRITKSERVICPNCNGTGGWWVGSGGDKRWHACETCNNARSWNESHEETCPTCGGDGKITCKTCGGSKKCGMCNGSGKTECKACSGVGECKECGGTGKAKYTWWCVQEQLSLSEKKSMGDKAEELSTAHTWDNDDCAKDRIEDMSTICDIKADKDVFQGELLDQKYPGSCLTSKGSNEEDAVSVGKTFSGLWQSLRKKLLSRATNSASRKDDFKVVRQQYKIERIPVVAKYYVSMFGKKGVLLEDLTMSCNWNGDLSKIEREYRRRTISRAWLRSDLWLAATLAVSAGMVAVPLAFSGKSAVEYLTEVFTPALITGIGAFLAVEFLFWYFYSYVWDLVERSRFSKSWDKFGAGVKGYDWKIWESGLTNNVKRILRLLWLLMPIAVIQGAYANIPQVTSFLAPVSDFFACISSTEWSYIASVCALKVGIIWASKRWDWKFAVEKGLIIFLAAISLAFVIWPTHLPEGMALKGAMEQALPFVALPVRFIGLAVYWPLCIALWLLGFVGKMAVSLVMWVVSLFM